MRSGTSPRRKRTEKNPATRVAFHINIVMLDNGEKNVEESKDKETGTIGIVNCPPLLIC